MPAHSQRHSLAMLTRTSNPAASHVGGLWRAQAMSGRCGLASLHSRVSPAAAEVWCQVRAFSPAAALSGVEARDRAKPPHPAPGESEWLSALAAVAAAPCWPSAGLAYGVERAALLWRLRDGPPAPREPSFTICAVDVDCPSNVQPSSRVFCAQDGQISTDIQRESLQPPARDRQGCQPTRQPGCCPSRWLTGSECEAVAAAAVLAN